jgi:iron complex outermembrane receptor protein
MFGLTAGITDAQWSVDVFAENIGDERAEIANSFMYDRQRVTYARPFNGGVRVAYEF